MKQRNPKNKGPTPKNVVDVWHFSLISAREEMAVLASWLDRRENQALDRMVSVTEREKRIVCWGRVRQILSTYLTLSPADVGIRRSSIGRPQVVSPQETDLCFSLTHSGDRGLLAVSRMTVGLDLEYVRSSVDATAISARFFTRSEAEAIACLSASEQVDAFFRVWVRKEAYLKAVGGSVPAGLSKFEVSSHASEPLVVAAGFEAVGLSCQLMDVLVYQGYLAALAMLGDCADIRIHHLNVSDIPGNGFSQREITAP